MKEPKNSILVDDDAKNVIGGIRYNKLQTRCFFVPPMSGLTFEHMSILKDLNENPLNKFDYKLRFVPQHAEADDSILLTDYPLGGRAELAESKTKVDFFFEQKSAIANGRVAALKQFHSAFLAKLRTDEYSEASTFQECFRIFSSTPDGKQVLAPFVHNSTDEYPIHTGTLVQVGEEFGTVERILVQRDAGGSHDFSEVPADVRKFQDQWVDKDHYKHIAVSKKWRGNIDDSRILKESVELVDADDYLNYNVPTAEGFAQKWMHVYQPKNEHRQQIVRKFTTIGHYEDVQTDNDQDIGGRETRYWVQFQKGGGRLISRDEFAVTKLFDPKFDFDFLFPVGESILGNWVARETKFIEAQHVAAQVSEEKQPGTRGQQEGGQGEHRAQASTRTPRGGLCARLCSYLS